MYIDKFFGNQYGILTEEGIDLGDGEIIREGRILEIARECRDLIKEDKYNEFSQLVAKAIYELSYDDYELFRYTRLLEFNNVYICDKFREYVSCKNSQFIRTT